MDDHDTSPLPFWIRARADATRSVARALLSAAPLRSAFARRRPAIHDGRRVEPATAAMLAMDDLMTKKDLATMTVAAARLRVLEQVRIADGHPPGGVTTLDRTCPSADARLLMRVYTPDALDRRTVAPAIVYFHGGGWVTCDLDTHDGFCRRLALGTGAKVFSVDYRLSPEHRFPAAVHDAVAATRWVFSEATSLGVDPGRVAVAGDSAGGNLAAVVARHLREDADRPSLQILIYPATDATFSCASHRALADGWLLTRSNIDWYLAHYAPGVDPTDPDLSPLHAKSVHGCASAIVVTAGLDPLRDEGAAYAEKLKAAAVNATLVEHEGLVHGFALMTALVPAAARAVDDLTDRIRAAI